jgi:hypothetical protein
LAYPGVRAGDYHNSAFKLRHWIYTSRFPDEESFMSCKSCTAAPVKWDAAEASDRSTASRPEPPHSGCALVIAIRDFKVHNGYKAQLHRILIAFIYFTCHFAYFVAFVYSPTRAVRAETYGLISGYGLHLMAATPLIGHTVTCLTDFWIGALSIGHIRLYMLL